MSNIAPLNSVERKYMWIVLKCFRSWQPHDVHVERAKLASQMRSIERLRVVRSLATNLFNLMNKWEKNGGPPKAHR